MGKIAGLLLISIIIMSCSYPELPLIYGDEEIPDLDLESPHDVFAWTARNITYARDDGDEWQAPQYTYEVGHGDCEDYCLLALYLLYREFGIQATMMFGNDNTGTMGHFWIELDGEWWEPQGNKRCECYRDRYSIINDNRDMRAWTFLIRCM